jgi:ABC-type sugar transport system permease subunit
MRIIEESWRAKTSVRAPGQATRPDWGAVNYLYILPALLLFVGILVLPMLQSAYFSFLNWDRLPVTALILALLLEFVVRSAKWRAVARTVLFIPMTISSVAVGLLFALFYNPLMGVINNLAMSFGVLSTLDLLGNSKTTVIAIFAVAVWQWSGFGMVIFCAALQSLPSELLDAARIDGAGTLRTIRYVVIPLLLPTYFVVMTINVIGGFKAFDLIYVMTAGGPAGASETTSIFLYKQAFVLHKFGYASAVAIVLFLIVATVTLLLTAHRFSRR